MITFSKYSKKTKILIAGGLAVVVIGGGTAAKVYADEQKKQELSIAQQEYNTNLRDIAENGSTYKKVMALFDEKKDSFLAKGLTEEKISEAEREIDSNTDIVASVLAEYDSLNSTKFEKQEKRLREKIAEATEKLNAQTELNKLFDTIDKSMAIDGAKVNKELPINERVTDEEINKISDKLKSLEKSEWKTETEAVLKGAKDQIDQLKKATESINNLFDKETVNDDVTEDSFNKAKTEVEKVKNETSKKELSDKLTKVREKLDKKKEELQKEAEEKGGTLVQDENGNYKVEEPSNNSNNYSENGNNSNNNYNPSAGGNSSGGGNSGGNGYNPPSNSGGSSSGGSGNSGGGNSGGGNSVESPSTGGGTVGGGATGGNGDNTWEGGQFDDPGWDW